MREWCRYGGCARPAVFHVLVTLDPAYSNLCRIHTADAMREGAHSAHQLTPECFDTMYFPEVATWLPGDNRCGLLVTPIDPFEGWRLQNA